MLAFLIAGVALVLSLLACVTIASRPSSTPEAEQRRLKSDMG
jgi:hypothetical protein